MAEPATSLLAKEQSMLSRRVVFTVFLCVFVPRMASAGEWISLFDGRTLDGWTPAAHGQAEYEVIDGAIQGTTVEGSPNSFLASDDEYGDFELEFQVRVHDSLNSGAQIRSRERSQEDIDAGSSGQLHRFFGPQVEIESSPGQSAYIYGEATGHGWLSPEPEQEPGAAHAFMKNGEWNDFRIVAVGPRIQTWINGNKVADLTHDGVYKTHPQGKIGLQVHGIGKGTGPYQVSWRNIRLLRR
jgi:hypothetical protein